MGLSWLGWRGSKNYPYVRIKERHPYRSARGQLGLVIGKATKAGTEYWEVFVPAIACSRYDYVDTLPENCEVLGGKRPTS